MAPKVEGTSVAIEDVDGEIQGEENPGVVADLMDKDPDDIALEKALEELKKEEDGGTALGEEVVPEAETPKPAAEPVVGKEPETPQGYVQVPLPALQEARRANQTMAQRIAFLEGQNSVLSAMTKSQAGAGTPEASNKSLTPEEKRLAQIDEETLAIAREFDAGRISMEEAKQQENALHKEERQILASTLSRPSQTTPQEPTNDATMEEHLATLFKEYPAINSLAKEDWQYIRNKVERNAGAAGTPYGSGPLETMRLREDMAATAQKWFGEASTQPQPTATNGGAAALSAVAQARERKLRMGTNAPVDVSTLGSAGHGSPTSDREIEQRLAMMHDEEERIEYIAALPASVRQRLELQ